MRVIFKVLITTYKAGNLYILETIFIQSKNEYLEGYYFTLKRNTSHLQILAYEDYRKNKIQFLLDGKFLILSSNNILDFGNLENIVILKDLFENELSTYWYFPLSFRKVVDEMTSQEVVHFTNSLYTKPEKDYFNHYSNKAEFTNGLDLRNKYLHGTQSFVYKEDEYENSYFLLLKLPILVIYKIEDDLHINSVIT